MAYITRDDDISVLPLSVRSTNALRRAGIHTVGELLRYSEGELREIKNLGAKSVMEILSVVSGLQMLAESGEVDTIASPKVKRDDSAERTKSGGVFVGADGVEYYDVPLEQLGLSVRAYNRLRGKGLQFGSELLGVTEEELYAIRNLGSKTVNEILEVSRKMHFERVQPYGQAASGDATEKESGGIALASTLVGELTNTFGGSRGYWAKLVKETGDEHPEVGVDMLPYLLYRRPDIADTAKDWILRQVENHGDSLGRERLFELLPLHLRNTTVPEELLLALEQEGKISLEGEIIYRQYPSVWEAVEQLKDERACSILQMRMNGSTLQEVGEAFGMTRERVRQIEGKHIRKLPRVAEDKYRDIFAKYDFDRESFRLAFDEPPYVYNYLEMTGVRVREPKGGWVETRKGTVWKKNEKSGRKNLAELLTDETVSVEMRRQVERAVYKDYVTIDGVRVRKKRPELTERFIKQFCRDSVPYSEFIKAFNQWLMDLGISDDRLLLTDERAYENKLAASSNVLWSHGKTFRYYDIPSRDYSEFLAELDLEQYMDTEISSLLLWRNHGELMREFDIRDEYELHNLLRKIDLGDLPVTFGKMPTIIIGDADRDEQVFDLLFEYAPIAIEDLAAKYEETYGVRAATAMANYFSHFDEYLHDSMFRIDLPALPPERMDRMREELTGDYYPIQKIRGVYQRLYPGAGTAEINPYTLKRMGFSVYSGYVIRNTYPSAVAYFDHLLMDEDVVDLTDAEPSLLSNVSFTSSLYHHKAQRDIVEFAPKKYISIRRLMQSGITKDDLNSYCGAVAGAVDRGELFTVKSLRRAGFVHPLDELGFEDLFYTSLLVEDRDHFSYCRIGGTKLLYRGNRQINIIDLLEDILLRRDRMDVDELQELLDNTYGICLDRYKLLELIHKSELYYDTIMDAVYISYDTYLEEI